MEIMEFELDLQNISRILKSSERIKLVDDFNMCCFEIWLNKSLVHRIYLCEKEVHENYYNYSLFWRHLIKHLRLLLGMISQNS